MLKCSLTTLLIVSTLTFQTGCNLLQSSSRVAKRERSLHRAYATRLQEKEDQYLSLVRAHNQLSSRMRMLSQSSANHESQLKTLEQKILKMERASTTLNNQFEQKLAAERQLREQHNKELMRQMSTQIANTANKLQDEQKKVFNVLSQPAASNTDEYIVQSGDTLSLIAKAFRISISDIKAANHLRGDMIRIGQKLIIPLTN